ncbi:glycoside hydrolase family 3 protein [Candidatus Woesebacteria bacterium]|nr:glycoside hydrolase family 3 protein [Candidatus Woesebacteria bacterium]
MKFPKTTLLLILLLLFFCVVLGYNYVWRPFAGSMVATESQEDQATTAGELTAVQPSRRWQLTNLTPEQKVGQLLMVPFELNQSNASDEAKLQQWLTLEPGGLVLFGKSISAIEAKRFSTMLNQSSAPDSISTILAVDHEGGDVQRLAGNGFSILPSARELCKQTEEIRVAELDQSAQELSLAGIHMIFGPVLDVSSRSGVLKSRVCSGDPTLVGQYGKEFVTAFSNHGIVSVLKHYPGIGSITRDLHTSFDQQMVLAKDVLPFKSILDAFPTIGVMVSHMGVVNQIPDLPCSLSADCIEQLTITNPQALVISDSLTMKAATYDGETNTYTRTLESEALSAVYAGNQILLFGPETTPAELQKVKSALVAQYAVDPSFAKQVDSAVERILDAKEFQIFK